MIENTQSGAKSNLVGVDRARKAPEAALGGKKVTEQSAKVRSETSEEITDCFVAVLKELPPGSKPTAAEVAELLNQRGINTSWGNKWHKDNVRHHLRKAKEKLRQIREAPRNRKTKGRIRRSQNDEWGMGRGFRRDAFQSPFRDVLRRYKIAKFNSGPPYRKTSPKNFHNDINALPMCRGNSQSHSEVATESGGMGGSFFRDRPPIPHR